MKRIIFIAGILLMLCGLTLGAWAASPDGEVFTDTDQLRGHTVGVITGGTTAILTEEYFDGEVNFEYFNQNTDMIAALDAGKIDAYVMDMYGAQFQCEEHPNQTVLAPAIKEAPAGFIFRKDDPDAAALRGEINEYLAAIRADGTYDEIYEIWMGKDDSKKVVDLDFSGERGELVMGSSTNIGSPFCFMLNGKMVGLELDIAARFCREYGYSLRFEDYDYGALINAVASGKVDFAGDSVMVTPERAESVDFSDETCLMGFVAVARRDAADAEQSGFFAKIASSFEKTFLRESRWKLFLNGIANTLLITVLSVVLGTALGFGAYMSCRRGNRIADAIVRFFSWLIHGMPVVVFLMILFYIVFGKSSVSGLWISVLAFTLVFAVAFTAMLRAGVAAVNPGQLEAALALGYPERRAFMNFILPQAALHMLPSYKAELVSLIKSTAIVGYIAVQDLTKVSDIIRARTYEAFFPLIATAVIYFLLAALLNFLVEQLHRRLDLRLRSEQKILKGAVLR